MHIRTLSHPPQISWIESQVLFISTLSYTALVSCHFEHTYCIRYPWIAPILLSWIFLFAIIPLNYPRHLSITHHHGLISSTSQQSLGYLIDREKLDPCALYFCCNSLPEQWGTKRGKTGLGVALCFFKGAFAYWRANGCFFKWCFEPFASVALL